MKHQSPLDYKKMSAILKQFYYDRYWPANHSDSYYALSYPCHLLDCLNTDNVSARRFRLIAAASMWSVKEESFRVTRNHKHGFEEEDWADYGAVPDYVIHDDSGYSRSRFPIDFGRHIVQWCSYHRGYLNIEQYNANQCCLIRDIIGPPEGLPSCLPWVSKDVLAIARKAYSDRLHLGVLDHAVLGVLSDALEEGGLSDSKILTDLRTKRNRYRGYWILDWILDLIPGKE